MAEHWFERAWESTSGLAVALRVALAPASWVYSGLIGARNSAYDRGWLKAHSLGLPSVSIGNLTVGGTGKTPVAAWIASRLIEVGARPAILLRGYGGDELRVHKMLVPGAIVEAGADRLRSAARARAEGATVLVLDDGFQHRSVRRDVDVVLVSADRHRRVRLLPAGPWRESERSLGRATHIIVIRKRTTSLHANEVAEYVSRMAPSAKVSIVHLDADALVQWGSGERRPVGTLAGMSVVAISAIGDPRAFEAQVRATGARVMVRTFPDHHAFSDADVARLADDATRADVALCTLKDAVKLGPGWPPSAPPLWYLSQHVRIELGADALDGIVRCLAGLAHD